MSSVKFTDLKHLVTNMDFETKEIIETVVSISSVLFKVALVIGAIHLSIYLIN